MINAVSILGSTGSIGRQSIAAAKHLGVPVVALTANRKTDLVEQQARELKPKFVAIFDENAEKDLKLDLPIPIFASAAGWRDSLKQQR